MTENDKSNFAWKESDSLKDFESFSLHLYDAKEAVSEFCHLHFVKQLEWYRCIQ